MILKATLLQYETGLEIIPEKGSTHKRQKTRKTLCTLKRGLAVNGSVQLGGLCQARVRVGASFS